MAEKLPSRWEEFANSYPEVWRAFCELGEASADAGPLDERTRRLVKLAIAVGKGSEGAVHSHVRRAVAEGLTAEELRHVAVLAITTLGFSSAMAALSWMDDILPS
jgi:AhpD family alkylhydroperoxidase